jgi:hypothetical protein
MGGGINTSEMFEKLESMRAVVTEVNAQFKNPVRPPFPSIPDNQLTHSLHRILPPSFRS